MASVWKSAPGEPAEDWPVFRNSFWFGEQGKQR
jgi:hypothetical protein